MKRSSVLECHQLQRYALRKQVRRYRVCIVVAAAKQDPPRRVKCDVVLSSGFLAFANHSGFLQAVEVAGIDVQGVMGTSAGALAGSLYCAGYSPKEVAKELSRVPPVELLRPCFRPWRGGVLSLHRVVDRLRELLPPRFEDLKRELAVAVVTRRGEYVCIDSGPLPEVVAASAAIPFLFAHVHVPGKGLCMDGGVVDRVGLKPWRDRRRLQGSCLDPKTTAFPPACVHIIRRSSPFSGTDDLQASGETRVTVVNSPKSGVNLWHLGDFEAQMLAAFDRALPMAMQLAQHENKKVTQRLEIGLR